MSYDFNINASELNSFPHPLKHENIALLSAAALLVTGSISVLLSAQSYIGNQQDSAAIAAIILSVGLSGIAIKFGAQALSQLRFVLGLKFPIGLADELPTNRNGLAPGALAVIKTLSQRCIEFPEPKGPFDGILYGIAASLGSAPAPVQFAAVKHFHMVVASAALLLSMLASFILFRQSAYEGLVSWIYLPLAGLSLMLPFSNLRDDVNASSETNNAPAALWKLISLIAFSILAPALLPRCLPAYPVGSFWLAPLLLLIDTLITSWLFLVTLFTRLDQISQTDVSCEQTSVSMNCHPSQLWIEAKRNFRGNWVRGIPNRVYAYVPPGLADAAPGMFQGYLLEETQPIPTPSSDASSSREACAGKSPQHRFALVGWGLIMTMSAALVAVCTAPKLESMTAAEIVRILLIVGALGISALRTFRIGHLLWTRIHFRSRLVLIVIDGTFQSAELSIGNQFTDHVQSKSMLTRVENASLRVWVADVDSVAFGKNGRRSIISMKSSDGYAKEISEELLRFAQDQSSIAAPTSRQDLEKSQTLMQFNAMFSATRTSAESQPL